jgi:Arylsulfatase A and related enzymes
MVLTLIFLIPLFSSAQKKPSNVLLIIADDLTTTALGSYGNEMVKTPALNQLAEESFYFRAGFILNIRSAVLPGLL